MCSLCSGGGVKISLGLNVGGNVIEFNEHFDLLNQRPVISNYRKSDRRLLLLDYEGTLTPYTLDKQRSEYVDPTAHIMRLLAKLAADPKNVVCMMMARTRNVAERRFGKVPVLTLVAEHGFYLSWGNNLNPASSPMASPTSEEVPRVWENLIPDADFSWMEVCASSSSSLCTPCFALANP